MLDWNKLGGLLAHRSGHWLNLPEAEQGIVLSTTVRGRANLAERPSGDPEQQARAVACEVAAAAAELPRLAQAWPLDLASLPQRSRELLFERRWIRRGFAASAEPGTEVIVAPEQGLAITVNDGVDLCVQCRRPGFACARAWSACNLLLGELGEHLDFEHEAAAAAPMAEAEVMLHLAASAVAGWLGPTAAALRRLGFELYPAFGNGPDAPGGFLLLGASGTIADSWPAALAGLEAMAGRLVEIESNARRLLLSRQSQRLADLVGRSYGALKYAHQLEHEEAADRLSALRLGVQLGMFTSLSLDDLNELLMLTQPGHLQRYAHSWLDHEEQAALRAWLIRQRLHEIETGKPADG